MLWNLVALLFSCSTSTSNAPVASDDPEHEGMVLISAKGNNVFLGTNDDSAPVKERPQMRVQFTYDYSIGKNEVTCSQFNSVMEEYELSVPCAADDLPAVNLTFFDAVLYVNALSKQEKLDTVYTYRSLSQDAEKHCVGMEGFAFHPELEGFRLPTEAEWVFAAEKGWNPERSWNAETSDYKAHSVCSSSKNDNGICDLAGNVKEWVNDWLGYFRDTTLVNYVGAPDGGSVGERVVKGGSFRNEVFGIRLYSRGDVYTVTSSTKGDYLGFRVAIGEIPNATWMSSNGSASNSRIVPLANSGSVKALTGTFRTKLVARNDLTGNLIYVDYSNGSLSVVEISDSIDSYHPDISPDGKYVAFCTKFEGLEGKSKLYVRDLNPQGNNLIALDVESAAIPRWRVLASGDTVIVYVSDAGNNKDQSDFNSKSTWQVSFNNGKFGTPKKLYDGAYHGGVSYDDRLAVTGARLLRAKMDDLDSVWYNSEQACNVSLSRDSTKRTLFLDFGGKTGRDFVDVKYGTHEYMLIADSLGVLNKAVKAPEGYSFDHSEWVVSGGTAERLDLAVVSLTNAMGSHDKLAIVDVENGSITELLEGDELWHPSLWAASTMPVDGASFLNADSAGAYLLESSELGPQLLRYKMELLWRYKDSANVVVVGSSRPLDAVSPDEFDEGHFAINMAQTPNSLYMSRDILENYVYPHVKNLRYVVISLDLDFWYKIEVDNFFYNEYKAYPGYVYDMNHDYWKDGYPSGLLEYTERALGVETPEVFVEDRGRLTSTVCYGWGDKAEVEFDSTVYDGKEYIAKSLGVLRQMIESASSRNVYLVGIVFPQHPGYKKTGAFGRYGLRRSIAEKVIEDLKKLGESYPIFIFMDENRMGDHDYNDSMSQDNDHLCFEGGKQITSRIDSVLWTLK